MKRPIFIKNATVITPYHVLKKASIFISDGKIKDVRQAGNAVLPKGTRIIDAKNNIVAPGFIDVHVQGAGGSDVLDGTKYALQNIAKTLAKNGTTSFLATTVATDKASPHLKIIDEVIRAGTGGANILGIHLEGPYINPLKKGMIKPENIKEASLADLNRIIRLCKGRLRMMTIAPEVKGALVIIPVLRKRGIVASFGHSNATYEQTLKGLKNGISHATHVFNAMPQLHHRMPGPLAALFEDKKCTLQLVGDAVHIHPSVMRLLIKIVGVDRIVLITDSMSAAGLKNGKYVYNGLEYISYNGTARYKDGTLIGTSLALREVATRMIRLAGVSLQDAVKMATINPAKTLGIEYKKGSITPSKDADLVIMDKKLFVKKVIIGGKVIF